MVLQRSNKNSKIRNCNKKYFLITMEVFSLPMASDFSIHARSKNNDVSSILTSPNVRTRAYKHFTLKTMQLYLLPESTDQDRSTNPTSAITGSMRTHKNKRTSQCLRGSRKPFPILHKNLFNKRFNIKMR